MPRMNTKLSIHLVHEISRDWDGAPRGETMRKPVVLNEADRTDAEKRAARWSKIEKLSPAVRMAGLVGALVGLPLLTRMAHLMPSGWTVPPVAGGEGALASIAFFTSGKFVTKKADAARDVVREDNWNRGDLQNFESSMRQRIKHSLAESAAARDARQQVKDGTYKTALFGKGATERATNVNVTLGAFASMSELIGRGVDVPRTTQWKLGQSVERIGRRAAGVQRGYTG